LKGNTGVIAVEVAVLDEILNCIDDLEKLVRRAKSYEYATDLLQHISLLETCFQH
jgi:hypothetical protein